MKSINFARYITVRVIYILQVTQENLEIESFYSFGCVTYFKAICLARYQIVPSNPGISLEFALHRCIYILDKLRHLS